MHTALIIVDPQNDFCDFYEGNSVGVKDSEQIFPIINQLKKMDIFSKVFVTLDEHPSDHISFAQNHGKQPGQQIIHKKRKQMLWPTHCLKGSQGAKISKMLRINNDQIFVKKGRKNSVQQYSGFGTKHYPTVLKKKLHSFQIQRVVIVGLAFDFCVGNTALDAKQAGFQTIIIKEATKSTGKTTERLMAKRLIQKGVKIQSIRDF